LYKLYSLNKILPLLSLLPNSLSSRKDDIDRYNNNNNNMNLEGVNIFPLKNYTCEYDFWESFTMFC